MGRKTTFGIGFGILLLWVFLLFNSEALFGSYASVAQETLTIYMIFIAVILASINISLPGLSARSDQLLWFGVFGILTWILISLLPSVVLGTFASFEGVRAAFALGSIYALVKAFPEEVVFRLILPRRIPMFLGVRGKYWAQILFGAFHTGVIMSIPGVTLGAAVLGLVLLTFLGVMWLFVAERYGLYAALGSHFMYNVAVITAGVAF